jgi:putative PIG3 family NAD(P)H quinone oxidoreductase
MHAIEDIQGRLAWTYRTTPEAGPGEIRIRVAATAVNRADLAQRTGHYPPPPGASPVLGLECSGVVDQVGEGVEWPREGDQVCALLSGGGYAEQVVLPAAHALPVPMGMSLAEAAALPEVFTTAWLNLRREGELKAGERVLIHAAASGVGTAALQLCTVWGNPTFATVGSAKKEERCRALGAQATANRKDGPWLSKVKAWGPVDVILDPVGATYLESNIHALRERGRLINIGLLGGREGTLPMGALLVKRLVLRGSVLRSRSVEEKASILAGMRQEVWPLLEDGSLRPIIDEVMEIERAQEAHELVERNQTVGKVILRVGSGPGA